MNKRPIVPHDLYGYQWISSPSINIHGEVVYVNQSIDQEKNEYQTHLRLSTLDREKDVQLTYGDKDSSPAWAPDGASLAFLRVVEGKKQLHIGVVDRLSDATDLIETKASSHGENRSELLNAVVKLPIEAGITSYVWSPNSKYIAFTSKAVFTAEGKLDRENNDRQNAGRRGLVFERTTPRAEGSGWWDGKYNHLFVIEIESGKITPITSGDFDVQEIVWSPDGQSLSFISKQSNDSEESTGAGKEIDLDLLHFADIYTVHYLGGNAKKITDCTLLISQFAYSPDGNKLIIIASDRLYGSGSFGRLYTVPTTGGQLALLSTADMHIGNAGLGDMKSAPPAKAPQCAVDESGTKIYVPVTIDGCVHLAAFKEDGAYQLVTSDTEIDIYQFTLSPDGKGIVYAALTAEHPGELYSLNLQSGTEQRITHRNDDYLAQLHVNIPERLSIPSSDGGQIHGWVVKPNVELTSKKIPLILQIHGGPHAMYTGTFSQEIQSLVAQGYAVLFTNPRGSFGYGQSFAKACRGDFAGGDYRDLMEAVDYALETYDFIDHQRLGVAGGSYGGVMTNWIVAHNDRFRAAVTQRCISNWISLYGTSDIGISYVEGVVGGSPTNNAEMLWSKSPLAHAHHIQTPLLILHGESDFRTPIGQAEELYSTLKRLGKTTKLIRYPKSNHSLLKSGIPSLRVDSFEQVNKWFNQFL